MEMAVWAVLIAAGALLLNFVDKVWGGGWRLSNRLTAIETSQEGTRSELAAIAKALREIADMRGDIRVLDTRVTAAEQDIRELRHGQGFVRGPGGIDREYT